MRLKGKVALITGAGSGIGRQTAILFAKEGAQVVCVDLNEKGAQQTAAMIRGALAFKADVSKARDCEQMVAAAENKFGKLNVLFNNAGIMHLKDDDAMTTSEEVWDLTLDVNAKGVFLGCKYGIPALRRAGGGAIVNTASFVAKMGAATAQIAYTASKGAVLSMTRELAVIPPSTTSSAPVMNEASSDARNSAALAISAASPKRPIGTCTRRRCRFSSVSRNFISSSVRSGPGHRALTRMPSRAWMTASSRLKASTAPLLAV